MKKMTVKNAYFFGRDAQGDWKTCIEADYTLYRDGKRIAALYGARHSEGAFQAVYEDGSTSLLRDRQFVQLEPH